MELEIKYNKQYNRKMVDMKNILAVTNDFGATGAMIPVVKELLKAGNSVEIFAFFGQPAFGLYQSAGFVPRTGTPEDLRTVVGESDAVICGITSSENGADRLALKMAIELNKPTFVVFETWPHRWLQVYKERDADLYKKATMIFVPDQASMELMVSKGFSREQVSVLGNPVWDSLIAERVNKETYRAEQRKKFGIPKDALVFLYTTTLDMDDQTIDKPEHPEWLGKSEESVIVEFLEAVREARKTNEHVRGIIREKPGYGRVKIERLIRENCPDVYFDDERYKGGTPTILASDVVFGMATLAVQNSALLGVPAFYYLPLLCREDPMIASNQAGLTIPLYTKGDMGAVIGEMAKSPKECVNQYLEKMNIPSAENSAEAIAEEISKMMV